MEQAQGVSRTVELAQVAEADRIRTEQKQARKQRTQRRHGNNGSRKWGVRGAVEDAWGWHESER